MVTREDARHALSGPIMSLNTPFLANGDIDYDGARRIIDFTIDAGSRTVILTAGDSLYTILTDQEVAEVTKVAAEHAGGRAMVVAADRSWWTGEEVQFARYCREVGADMLMVLPPDWAFSCSEDAFVRHYAAVAEEIPVMVVTNLFENRPVVETAQLIRRLRDEVEGIFAVKDDVHGDLGRRLGMLVHDRWGYFASGNKRAVIDDYPYGIDGYMSTFISFKPEIAHGFWAALQANDRGELMRVIEHLDVPLWDFYAKMPGSFDAAVHGMLELYGLAGRWRRDPYHSLTDEQMEQLAAFLKGLSLL